MKITWIAQGGFIFEVDGKRLVIDPYMSNDLIKLGHDRIVPVPISFADLKPDAVLFTHDHLDHYDPVTVSEIIKYYPNCTFIGTTSTFEHHKKLNLDTSNFIKFNTGNKLQICGMEITATKAYHTEPYTIGLLISDKNNLVYISSDTLYDPNLSSEIIAVAARKIDLAIVCINGKLGNMSWRDAVRLVEEMNPTSAMPMHYGLFLDNTEDPLPFADALKAKKINVIIPPLATPFSPPQ